jgi:hypothetical protein
MLKQLNLIDLVGAVKTRLEGNTQLSTHDVPPTNQPAPLVYIEVVGVEPRDSKTMYLKNYTLWLHVIADEVASSVPIYNHITEVQEAMTEDIELPAGFEMVLQSDDGIQTIKTDESGEKHAVLAYSFLVCFGYKQK